MSYEKEAEGFLSDSVARFEWAMKRGLKEEALQVVTSLREFGYTKESAELGAVLSCLSTGFGGLATFA